MRHGYERLSEAIANPSYDRGLFMLGQTEIEKYLKDFRVAIKLQESF